MLAYFKEWRLTIYEMAYNVTRKNLCTVIVMVFHHKWVFRLKICLTLSHRLYCLSQSNFFTTCSNTFENEQSVKLHSKYIELKTSEWWFAYAHVFFELIFFLVHRMTCSVFVRIIWLVLKTVLLQFIFKSIRNKKKHTYLNLYISNVSHILPSVVGSENVV